MFHKSCSDMFLAQGSFPAVLHTILAVASHATSNICTFTVNPRKFGNRTELIRSYEHLTPQPIFYSWD
jgi:hypothetical protein